VGTATSERVRGDIVRLVHRGLNTQDFVRGVTRALRVAVPLDGTCMLITDPATMLATGEVVDHALPASVLPRLFQIEHNEPDYNKFTRLARSRRPAASLSDATRGELSRSVRQRELREPSGFADELRAVCRDGTGTWGALTLLRSTGRPDFTPSEVRLVESLSGLLADGLRRAALLASALPADSPAADTGLLVLAADDSVELANHTADHWLGELVDGDGADLPLVVHAVAQRARASAADERDPPADGTGPGLARARVRTSSGRWLLVRGSLLRGGPRVAILLEQAGPPEMAPLIADAYGLTDRERLVTELVARGFSTSQIADRLHLSAYTVQDHLKSIFDKSGTASRGDLVARLFFDHYMPQLTDTTPLA
jgi:DNA-binding CsgD family transcriptional regulator